MKKIPPQWTAHRRKLDERAVRCISKEEFLGRRTGVHWLELHPEGRQSLRPALWKGPGQLDQYDSRTRHQPSVRMYSFCDEPVVLGKTGIVNAGEFLELGYHQFSETSRFHEFGNVALVEDFGDDVVTFRVPADHLHVEGDCALVTQKGDDVWGHWLVDVLPRIRMVRELLPEVTIVLSEAPDWSMDLLRHAGVDLAKVMSYNPFQTVLTADRLFHPSFVRFANGFSPLAKDIFASLPREAGQRTRKLYVTRSGTVRGSSIANHGEIEKIFFGRGFEVVSPESVPVEGQIALFAQASHIAGEYGSALHNSIFSFPGTRVLCLQSQAVNQFVQAGIGAVMAQPTGFVFGQTMTETQPIPNRSPSARDRYCSMDAVMIKEALDEFLQP